MNFKEMGPKRPSPIKPLRPEPLPKGVFWALGILGEEKAKNATVFIDLYVRGLTSSIEEFLTNPQVQGLTPDTVAEIQEEYYDTSFFSLIILPSISHLDTLERSEVGKFRGRRFQTLVTTWIDNDSWDKKAWKMNELFFQFSTFRPEYFKNSENSYRNSMRVFSYLFSAEFLTNQLERLEEEAKTQNKRLEVPIMNIKMALAEQREREE